MNSDPDGGLRRGTCLALARHVGGKSSNPLCIILKSLIQELTVLLQIAPGECHETFITEVPCYTCCGKLKRSHYSLT